LKMVEQMVEMMPESYQTVSKDFWCYITTKLPDFDENIENWAFCCHSPEQMKFCEVSEPHYHVLEQSTIKRHDKKHPVKCLYTCYLFLMSMKCNNTIAKIQGVSITTALQYHGPRRTIEYLNQSYKVCLLDKTYVDLYPTTRIIRNVKTAAYN
ncbi:MAG: hypothetical protein AAGD25_04785, partial [Cyanobacteria bacterium P01_F01_bin.150]